MDYTLNFVPEGFWKIKTRGCIGWYVGYTAKAALDQHLDFQARIKKIENDKTTN